MPHSHLSVHKPYLKKMKVNREETLKKSIECFSAGNLEDALKHTEEIVKEYPQDLQALTLISIIKEVTDKKDESEAILKQVLEINPNYPEALYLSGIKAGKKGDYWEAARLIQKAIDNQSKDAHKELAEYYQNLGASLWRLNLRFDAFRAWEKSIELNPEQQAAKDYLKNYSNEYGQPKAPSQKYDDFYAFQALKTEEYLKMGNKQKFDSLDEAHEIVEKIIKTWSSVLKERDLSKHSPDEKINLFRETKIDY